MKLVYKIEFNTTHYYYCDIINEIIELTKIKATSKLYDGFIIIDIDDESEVIEEFFIALEQKLPISIFVGNSEVIENFDESLVQIENKNLNPQISFSNDKIIDILRKYDGKFRETFENFQDDEIVFNNKKYYKTSKNEKEYILMCDVSKITEYFEINQKQMQLLSAIERPCVNLRVKYNKNLNNEFGKSNNVFVRFAKTKEEIEFAYAAKLTNIYYLITTDDAILSVMYNENDNIIISSNNEFYPRYDAINKKVYSTLNSQIEEYGSLYKLVLSEYGKRTSSSINIDFSLRSNNSAINIYVPTVGQKSIIKIPNIHMNLDEIFKEISQIDENCARLITNYSKKFPIANKDLSDANGIEAIIKVICKILNIGSVEEFEDIAVNSNLKSGLKIDMVLGKIDGVNYLDYRRVIQSIMSYKMADVPASMLCYSFYESLVDLVSENITKIETEIKTKDVVITGDLIQNSIFFEKIKKNLKAYNLIISKSYPLTLQ